MRKLTGDEKEALGQKIKQYDKKKETLRKEVAEQRIAERFIRGEKISAQVGKWIVTLDTFRRGGGQFSVTTYTRMRAPYMRRDKFRFGIYRRTFLSKLRGLFGLQDIEVGYPEFDSTLAL